MGSDFCADVRDDAVAGYAWFDPGRRNGRHLRKLPDREDGTENAGGVNRNLKNAAPFFF